MRPIIRLAEKYELVPALQACETLIGTDLAQKPTVVEDAASPFGRLQLPRGAFILDLPFLELLWQAKLMRAYRLIEPYYAQNISNAVAEAAGAPRYREGYKEGYRRARSRSGYSDEVSVDAAVNFASQAKLKALQTAFDCYVAGANPSAAKMHVMNTLITQLFAKLAQQS